MDPEVGDAEPDHSSRSSPKPVLATKPRAQRDNVRRAGDAAVQKWCDSLSRRASAAMHRWFSQTDTGVVYLPSDADDGPNHSADDDAERRARDGLIPSARFLDRIDANGVVAAPCYWCGRVGRTGRLEVLPLLLTPARRICHLCATRGATTKAE